MDYFQTKVLANRQISSGIWIMTTGTNQAPVNPGQFFMIKGWDNELTLMRPISIYSFDEQKLEFMYRVVGKGTEWLSKMKKGATVHLLGPLGNGFPCEEVSGNIALVGGGVGIPPLLETAKKLSQRNQSVDVYLGFRDDVFICEEFEPFANNIFISSEVGEEGYKGYITDLLKPEKYQAVFTCGPEVMMNKVLQMCRNVQVPVWLSMERRMGCGIGACLVCNCQTKDGVKRTCSDGPVFSDKMLD